MVLPEAAAKGFKLIALQRYVAPYNVAIIYAGLGEKDKPFSWIERAYNDRGYYCPPT
jgi:hypothetical protein